MFGCKFVIGSLKNPSSLPLSVIVPLVIDTFGVVVYINPLFLIKVSVEIISVFSEKLFDVTFVAETSNSMAGVGQFKLRRLETL